MASYHLTIKPGELRNAGRHFIYVCREDKYQKKLDLEYSEYGNMPSWAIDNPKEFWKATDDFERSNGTPYRELEIALPNELSKEQRKELVQEFVKEIIGDNHPYTVGIHCPKATLNHGIDQPHAHVMFSERKLDGIDRDKITFFKRANSKDPEKGGAKKDTRWYGKERAKELEIIRETWADLQNLALKRCGHEIRVDHRCLEEQRKSALERGDVETAKMLDRVPEKHLGPKIANKTVREVNIHISTGKTLKEKQLLRQEYYESIVQSDRARMVADIRELKRINREIFKIEHSLRKDDLSLGKPEIGKAASNIYKINTRIGELNSNRRNLIKSIVTPERANMIAISIFLKTNQTGTNQLSNVHTKFYSELTKEKDSLQKEFIKYEREVKKHSEITPSLFDINGKREYRQKADELEMIVYNKVRNLKKRKAIGNSEMVSC